MLKSVVTAFALVLASTPLAAQTAPTFAPAGERFGQMRLSPPAVATVIGRMEIRLAAFSSWSPSVFGPLAAAEDALRDWEERYPDDPRVARNLLALETVYLGARGDAGLQRAIRTEAWLQRDYPGTTFAAEGEAALGRIAAPPAPPPLPEAPALDAPVPAAPPANVPVTPLRRLDYTLNLGADGGQRAGSVHLDLIATHGEGAVTVDVAEELRESDGRAIRAEIAHDGTISTVLGATLSHAQLALLGAFSLGTENINGVDVGDAWQRETTIPGGHASTHYTVAKNDGHGRVVLNVTRRLQFENGEQSSWNGNVEYDTNSFAPIAVAFNGNISAKNSDPQPRRVSLNLKLQNDTFTKRAAQ